MALDLAQAVRRVPDSPRGPQKEQKAFVYDVLCASILTLTYLPWCSNSLNDCNMVLALTSALTEGQRPAAPLL